MLHLRLLAALCLLVLADCANVDTLATACTAGTDTCTVANSNCWDPDEDGTTNCVCNAGYLSDGGTPAACTTGKAPNVACAATSECNLGQTCTDTDSDGTDDTCLCTAGHHVVDTYCVNDVGASCVVNGISCGSGGTCVDTNGDTTVTTCQCSSGYFSDGVKCVQGSGGNAASVSLLIMCTAFVLLRIL